MCGNAFWFRVIGKYAIFRYWAVSFWPQRLTDFVQRFFITFVCWKIRTWRIAVSLCRRAIRFRQTASVISFFCCELGRVWESISNSKRETPRKSLCFGCTSAQIERSWTSTGRKAAAAAAQVYFKSRRELLRQKRSFLVKGRGFTTLPGKINMS